MAKTKYDRAERRVWTRKPITQVVGNKKKKEETDPKHKGRHSS